MEKLSFGELQTSYQEAVEADPEQLAIEQGNIEVPPERVCCTPALLAFAKEHPILAGILGLALITGGIALEIDHADSAHAEGKSFGHHSDYPESTQLGNEEIAPQKAENTKLEVVFEREETTAIDAQNDEDDSYRGPTLITPLFPEDLRSLAAAPLKLQEYYRTDPARRLAVINELSREPHFGRVEVPILCVEFPDQEHNLSTDKVQEVYTELTDYFSWISYEQVEVVFDACLGNKWFITPHELAFYQKDYPDNIQGLVEWVIKEADKSVDFSPFGNGDASGVVGVITAGSQDTAPLSGIVGHAWFLPNPVTADGIEFAHYHSVTEFFKRSGQLHPLPLGVAAHEAGHNLWGWWDLYDPNGGGIGYWSLMSSGAWGGWPPGSSPSNLDPWHKYKMGWLEPSWVENTARINLPPYEKESQALGLRLNDREYFLGVNYQPLDYDRSLGEAAGLVLFHINEDSIGQVFEGDPAAPKCVWPRPYMVMVEEADGVYDLLTRYVQPYWHRADAFPGSTQTTRLFANDPESRPNLAAYRSCSSAFEIFGVEQLGNNDISFAVIKRPLPYQLYFPQVLR